MAFLKWLVGITIIACTVIMTVFVLKQHQSIDDTYPEEADDQQPLAMAKSIALHDQPRYSYRRQGTMYDRSNYTQYLGPDPWQGDCLVFEWPQEYAFQYMPYPPYQNDDFTLEDNDCCQQPCCSSSCCEASVDSCQLIFGAAFGDYIGLKRGFAELGVFTSFALDDSLHAFVDAREFRLYDGQWASSLGVGFRGPGCDCCSVLGANIYYDYLQGAFRNPKFCKDSDLGYRYRSFNRIGLGLEYLSPCFDVRVNSYIPIIRTIVSTTPLRLTVSETFNADVQERHFLRWGIDTEVGRTLLRQNCFSSYLALGGYYYSHRELQSICGPTARFEVAWKQYLTLQLYYSYDRLFNSRVQGKILFTIPLEDLFNCFCGQCPCIDQYNRLVRRNFVPFVDKKCCWRWNW